MLASPDIDGDANLLGQLLNLTEKRIITSGESKQIILPNIEFNIQKAAHLSEARILSAQLSKNPADPVDLVIDSYFFQNL